MARPHPLIAPAISFFVALSAAASAGTWEVDRIHSGVGFAIRHLLTEVEGRFTDFEGTIEYDPADVAASRVTITVKSASLTTGVDKRDAHLRSPDFFDADKFPTLTFRSEKVVADGPDQLQVTGPLTLHGVTKTVTIPVKVLGLIDTKEFGSKAAFAAQFTIHRKDFGITWNRALDAGSTLLGDDVRITINVEANAKPAPAGKT